MIRERKLSPAIVVTLALLIAVVSAVSLSARRKPLGEAPRTDFQTTGSPQGALRQFLDEDFVILKNVDSLPRPVLEAFTEVGGARRVIANPGQKFEATDFIRDASIPRRRLIFAGVSGPRCFVLYEQGGRGRYYVLALFQLISSDNMKPVWKGQCGDPAKDIADLRSKVKTGKCF